MHLQHLQDPVTGYYFVYQEWFKEVRMSLARIIALWSGRGPGKSLQTCMHLLLLGFENKLRIGCFREIQKSISGSSKTTLDNWIRHPAAPWGPDFWRSTNSQIIGKNGTKITFHGLSSSHGTDKSVQSLEGIDLAFVEEAQNISEESYNLLMPTIRKPGSKVIFLMNPRLPIDPVWRYVVKQSGIDPKIFAKQLSWRDNYFWTEEQEHARRLCQRDQPEVYNWIYEGGFMAEGGYTVVTFDEMMACYEYEIPSNILRAAGIVDTGYDIAISPTGDKNAAITRRSNYVPDIKEWNGSKFSESEKHLREIIGGGTLYYDGTGVGGGFGDDFAGDTKLKPLHFGGAVKGKKVTFVKKMKNEEYFAKRNSQLYWTIRLRVKNTQKLINGELTKKDIKKCLFINPSIDRKIIERLASEGSGVGYKYNSAGKLTVDKMSGNTKSPNLWDALSCAFAKDSEQGLKFSLQRSSPQMPIILG